MCSPNTLAKFQGGPQSFTLLNKETKEKQDYQGLQFVFFGGVYELSSNGSSVGCGSPKVQDQIAQTLVVPSPSQVRPLRDDFKHGNVKLGLKRFILRIGDICNVNSPNFSVENFPKFVHFQQPISSSQSLEPKTPWNCNEALEEVSQCIWRVPYTYKEPHHTYQARCPLTCINHLVIY